MFRFEVMITTYETALADADVLGDIGWMALVVDEAQRLKNKQSSLCQVFSFFLDPLDPISFYDVYL